jgi:DNA-binding MarR family transcriptional regulator
MPEKSATIARKPAPDADRTTPVRTVMSEEEGLDFAIIELLFFAYRDFTSDPDQILAQYGFGRAHHRVVHFVNRRPGLTVAELLDVLKITKQSLARVLKQLIDTGHIVQVQGPRDRRQRELYPTAKGRALLLALAAPQSRRIARALEGSGAADRAAVERFLRNMVNPELRAQIGKTVPRGVDGGGKAKGGSEENRGEG